MLLLFVLFLSFFLSFGLMDNKSISCVFVIVDDGEAMRHLADGRVDVQCCSNACQYRSMPNGKTVTKPLFPVSYYMANLSWQIHTLQPSPTIKGLVNVLYFFKYYLFGPLQWLNDATLFSICCFFCVFLWQMIAALVVIICCSESWVESLPWSVWPFGVGQMRQNYAPVVWPDEMAIYHPVYRRQSAFLPQQLRHRPLRKSDGLSRGSAWINPSSVEVDSLFSFRGDREVALKPASGGILFAGDDDDSVIGGTHKQVHHRRPTPSPATTTTTTPCPLTTSTSNYEPVKVTRQWPISHRHLFIDNDLNLKTGNGRVFFTRGTGL